MTIEDIRKINNYELKKKIKLTVVTTNINEEKNKQKVLETENPYAILAFEDDEIFSFTEMVEYYSILILIKKDDWRIKDHDFIDYEEWRNK